MTWDIFRSADDIAAARKDFQAKSKIFSDNLVQLIDTTVTLKNTSIQMLQAYTGTDLKSDYEQLDAAREANKTFHTNVLRPSLDAWTAAYQQLDSAGQDVFLSPRNSLVRSYNATVDDAVLLKKNCVAIKNKIDSAMARDTSLTDGIAAVAGVPAAAATPAIPAVPAIPAIDGFPATPAIPAVPAMPALPAVPVTAFGNATASLSSIGDLSANLPPDMAATLSANQANLTAMMNSSVSTLSRDVGVTNTLLNMTNQASVAATGKPASDAALSAAAGPVAVLSQGPVQLAQHAADIAKQVSAAAGIFGAVLPPGVIAGTAAAAAIAGLAMKAFHAAIPPETISNPGYNPALPSDNSTTPPTNPATLPNPDYVVFASDPVNAARLANLSSMTSGISSMAESAESAFSNLQASASAALSAAITQIKSMSTLSLITAPAPAQITSALNNVVDYSKIDVAKVQNALNASAPSLPAGLPGPVQG
jgi:hypothetical protein